MFGDRTIPSGEFSDPISRGIGLPPMSAQDVGRLLCYCRDRLAIKPGRLADLLQVTSGTLRRLLQGTTDRAIRGPWLWLASTTLAVAVDIEASTVRFHEASAIPVAFWIRVHSLIFERQADFTKVLQNRLDILRAQAGATVGIDGPDSGQLVGIDGPDSGQLVGIDGPDSGQLVGIDGPPPKGKGSRKRLGGSKRAQASKSGS